MGGRPFDASQVPELTDLLPAALAGERDSEQLFHTIEPDGKFIFAVPIFGAGENAGRVLGVLVVNGESLPTESNLLFATLTLVARSLLVFALIAGIIGGIFGSLTAEGMVSRFKRLWAATDAWSRGDFSRFVHDPSGDEISQLAQRLNTMAVQLKELLQTRQQAAISEERNRLARDLHDSAKQDALAASFQLGTAITLLDSDPPAARKHLLEADHLVDSVRRELTDLIHELRPPAMERRELVQAMSDYVVEWAHQNEIEAELAVPDGDDGVGPKLRLDVEQAIYRIMQEALANIARHSSAGAAKIVLTQKPDSVTLTITDDGAGFDTGRQYSGMGLDSMRERAESLDGNFTIESKFGRGTVVSVTLPLPAD
jgi:NarL family two-component system sensor histidine kinase LiaS